jgi:hypothetical protein
MAMYNFLLPFREAKFCGVPSCVFDKLGRAAGEESLQNTGVRAEHRLRVSDNKLNFPAEWLALLLHIQCVCLRARS